MFVSVVMCWLVDLCVGVSVFHVLRGWIYVFVGGLMCHVGGFMCSKVDLCVRGWIKVTV